MLTFLVEGGFGLVPVLVLEIVLVLAAIRVAIRGEARWMRFVVAPGVALTVTILHATWTNLAAVFWYVSDASRASDAEFARILVTGLMESTRPGAVGGVFLALAAVAFAVGVFRDRPSDPGVENHA